MTLKMKGGKTVHFPLIGNLCRKYGYRSEAKGRVVDTVRAVIAPGQAKAPTTPTVINTFHCTYGNTHEMPIKKTAEQQAINLSGEVHEFRGCSLAKGLRKPITRSTHTRAGTPCPFRAPAATAPYCRKGGVYSGGGGDRGGRVKSRRREDGRLIQQVRPRHDGGVAPGATRNARGASGRAWRRGRGAAEGNPPTPSVSPGRANFGGINGSSSSSSSSDDSLTSSDNSNSNDSRDFPALVGKPSRNLEVSGELLALQSGRTRSQSRGLTMSASYVMPCWRMP